MGGASTVPGWARYGVFAVLLIVIVANAFLTPNFATVRNVEITSIQVVFVVLVGTGMTLVIATGGIDLSVGAVMGLVSVLVFDLLPYGPFAIIAACLVVGLAIGAINGILIAAFSVQPLLITLGSLISVRGARPVHQRRAEGVFPGSGDALHRPRPDRRRPGPGHRHAGHRRVVAFCRFAHRVRPAAGGGRRQPERGAARGRALCQHIIIAYAICGMLAALAGVFITARVGSTDPTNFGVLIELDAIAAVVVGGTALSGGRARVFGTLVGALVLQLVTAAMIMNNVSFHYSLIVKALIILVAVYLQRGPRDERGSGAGPAREGCRRRRCAALGRLRRCSSSSPSARAATRRSSSRRTSSTSSARTRCSACCLSA